MFKSFVKISLVLVFGFSSLSVFAKSIEFKINNDNFSEELINKLFDNELFGQFWSGDDGVECGEPYVYLDEIDYTKKLITLKGSLDGSAMECHEVNFTCKLNFVGIGVDSILIQGDNLDGEKSCGYDY